jgi:preprotein translocase subunit YajC
LNTLYLLKIKTKDIMISVAHAQTAASPSAGSLFSDGLNGLMFPIIMMAVLWAVMIRPHSKRQKEAKVMIDALKTGDEITTTGGILGKITKLTEQYIVLELNPGHEMTLQRSSVAHVLPKGTLKSII